MYVAIGVAKSLLHKQIAVPPLEAGFPRWYVVLTHTLMWLPDRILAKKRAAALKK